MTNDQRNDLFVHLVEEDGNYDYERNFYIVTVIMKKFFYVIDREILIKSITYKFYFTIDFKCFKKFK